MEKIKENVICDFWEMIENSWTFGKMNKEEKNRLVEVLDGVIVRDSLKGAYNQRWKILQAVYNSFLIGLGYDGMNWREENEYLPF